MKSKRLANPVVLLLACLMVTSSGMTQSAPVVLYHAFVTNTRGDPVTGSYELKFTLFDAATSGNPLWTETVAASISNGLFTAPLNAPAAVFNGLPRWLEVALRPGNTGDPFTTLSPRQQVGATPQSYFSLNAGQLNGISSSGFAGVAHTHGAQDIVSGVLGPARGGLGTDLSGAETGSILRKAGAGDWESVAPGTNGQVLKMAGGLPSWGTDNTGGSGGGGTITSLTPGTGIVLSPNPITSTGTVSIDRIKIPLLDDSNSWARVQSFGAGLNFPNGATFFLPEVNDEVLVIFEHGDMERPVVVDFLYSSKDPPPEHGPSRRLQAGDAAGANGDGGNIVLQPGRGTGSGANGRVIIQGPTNQGGGRFAFTLDPSPAPGGSAFKISDDQNPIPQDRIIFNVDYSGNPSWRLPAQGDISGNAATASNADQLDGFSWHDHPLLRGLNPSDWLANQVVTGGFPGIRLRGTLTDLSGQPREGLVGVTVRVYTTPTGGTPLYAEDFTQNISSGVLDIVLGVGYGTTTDDLMSALAPAAGGSFERYLTLQIEPDTEELTPRRRITANAYALYAVNAAQLGGQPASSYARVDQPAVFSTTPTFGAVSGAPFSVGNNQNVVASLNCDRLDGLSSEAFARVDTANTFSQPQTLDGGVRLRNYVLISFDDPFSTPPEQIIIYPSLASQPRSDQLAIAVDTLRGEVSLKADSVAAEHTGTSFKIGAGAGVGTDRNGGDIILQPGLGTGTGTSGAIRIEGGNSMQVFPEDPAPTGPYIYSIRLLPPHDLPGSLQYSATSKRWEISNNGGPSLAIATELPGGGLDANTFDGLDSLQLLRSDIDSTTAGSLSVLGTGRKLVSRATTADETTGNVNKLEVQSSSGAPRFAVTEKGSVTASGTLATRGFVVQYNESNQDFVTRLMEEEGIFYYFTHEGGSHQMVFGADNSSLEHSGQSFALKAGDGAGTDRNGGDVILRPGLGTGAGTSGAITIEGGNSLQVFPEDPAPTGPYIYSIRLLPPHDLPGSIQYSATTKRWEISNNGGPSLAIATEAPGGGLDADTLDGMDSSAFARLAQPNTFTQPQNFGGGALFGSVQITGSGNALRFQNGPTALNLDFTPGAVVFSGQPVDFSGTEPSFLTVHFNQPPGTAPFTVSSSTAVNNLNADLLDGLHASSFLAADTALQLGIDTEVAARNAAITGHNHTGGANGVQLSHSDLSNLGADDHLQYLHRDGSRAMTGTLQLGGNHVTGVGNNLTASGSLTVGASGNDNSLTLQTANGSGTENVNLTADDNVQITAVNGAITVNKPVTGAAAKAGTAAADPNPNVANLTALVLENYFAPTTLTGLQSGVNGQTVVLVGGNNSAPPIVPDTGAFKLRSDWQAFPDSTLTLVFVNGSWLETSRSAN